MRRIDDDDSDSDTVRDGETVSVRVNLTDTVRFDEDGREHFVRMADARRKKPPDDDDDDDGDTMDDNMQRAFDAHRPGFRFAPRAQRQSVCDARDQYVRQLTDAWRRTPTRTTRDAPQPDLGTRPDELAMRRHMYGAPGLPAASDPDVDSATTMRGHMGELFERSQRQRDRAWGSYKDQLSNAWRGGRTDPRRAAQVEGLQERWRHGRDRATEE
jgi:hypothetical protein